MGELSVNQGSPHSQFEAVLPTPPAFGALPGTTPGPTVSCPYHGEAHVSLLECRPIVGAIPGHGHHLPLLGVCAVDDACGVGQECAQGPGTLCGAEATRGGP